MSSKYDAMLLASGGMDSTVLAYKLKLESVRVLPVFVDYGQHCASVEYQTALRVLPREMASELAIIDLTSIYAHSASLMIRETDLWSETVTHDQLYLPYRNLLLLSSAAAFAQTVNVNRIYSAFINSNHATEVDCTREFFEQMNRLMNGIGATIIETPLADFSKAQVARLGLALGAPIAQTFSCQVNAHAHCGACPNCVDRLAAFESLGVTGNE